MGIHESHAQMLVESLPQYLQAAEIALFTPAESGGVLGYPSAVLLFCIVDAMGSYLRGKPEGSVEVEGRPRDIRTDADHYLVLNSKYFELSLSSETFKVLNDQCRNPLIHNAVLGMDVRLVAMEFQGRGPFYQVDGGVLEVCIENFLEACRAAIPRFLADIPSLVPTSRVVENLERKSKLMGGETGGAR